MHTHLNRLQTPASLDLAAPTRTLRSCRAGFSLIELLVVMSIIALLIGILLPALGPAMNAGRQTRCAANLRGIGQGIELYKNDFREVYPVARYMPQPWLSGDPAPSFNVAVGNYIEPLSMAYQCPGDKTVFDFEYTDADGVLRPSGSSYTYSSGLSGDRIEETFFVKRLGITPGMVPVMRDFDGGTYETQDGQFVSVNFFHNQRRLLYGDGSVDGSRSENTEVRRDGDRDNR